MKNTIALSVAITVGSFVHPGAQVQSLSIAMDQAWSRYPLAAAGATRTDEALPRIDNANRLRPSPASVSLANVNGQLNANRGKQEWEPEVATPLWLPDQRAARQNEAAAAQSDLAARQQVSRLQLAAELPESWWSLASALESDVQRRYKVGELTRVDANLTQNEALTAQAELAEAQSTRSQAEQNLRH
jgi:cobalt-zinc-cadmium efflux system outer membrane protein